MHIYNMHVANLYSFRVRVPTTPIYCVDTYILYATEDVGVDGDSLLNL